MGAHWGRMAAHSPQSRLIREWGEEFVSGYTASGIASADKRAAYALGLIAILAGIEQPLARIAAAIETARIKP
jgi:hypothetical protein